MLQHVNIPSLDRLVERCAPQPNIKPIANDERSEINVRVYKLKLKSLMKLKSIYRYTIVSLPRPRVACLIDISACNQGSER